MSRTQALVGVAALGQGVMFACAAALWWLSSALFSGENGVSLHDWVITAVLVVTGAVVFVAGMYVVGRTRRGRLLPLALISVVNVLVAVLAVIGVDFALPPTDWWLGVGVALVSALCSTLLAPG